MKSLYHKFAAPSRQAGFALLVTLTVITILFGVVVQANRNVRDVVISTATARDRRQLSWDAWSGVQAAMAMLVEDKRLTKADSVQENWALPEMRTQVLNELGIKGVEIQIDDCLAKLQVNALVKPPNGQQFAPSQQKLWDRFLRPIVTEHDFAEINATTDIINSLKDWLDKEDDDAITGVNGAESDHYQDLEPPYNSRNGYMLQVQEMLLVKGVTPELFYGVGEIPAIGPYITVYGAEVAGGQKKTLSYPGRINISTAPMEVIRALLSEEDEILAESIASHRLEREGDEFANDITKDAWYKNAPGCSDVTISADLITVVSDFFRIQATAKRGDVTSSLVVYVQRVKDEKIKDKYHCQVLSWQAL